MRYTVFHCHNPACGHRIWVPIHKLGTHGQCPECGQSITIPAELPPESFFDGPDVLEETEQSRAFVSIS